MDETPKESICRQTWALIAAIRSIPSEHDGLFQCAADGFPLKIPLTGSPPVTAPIIIQRFRPVDSYLRALSPLRGYSVRA
ncbi:hypothetical protein BDW62DRAFT_176010 [Aspergillus aurantiobrunneus]